MKNKINTEKSRIMLLCGIFGIFGFHEFYQKHYLKGSIYILLDLTIFGIIISALWAILSLLKMVLNKKNTDEEFVLGIIFLIIQLFITTYMLKNANTNVIYEIKTTTESGNNKSSTNYKATGITAIIHNQLKN
ncbi:MAG: hypothetical protein ACI4N3_05065 [Alphaproteobacteria bacterium]